MSTIDYSCLFDEFDSQIDLQMTPTQDEIFGLEEIKSTIAENFYG